MASKPSIPKFADVNSAVMWAHEVKGDEELIRMMSIKKENAAIMLMINHRWIKSKKEAARIAELLKDYECYKIALEIMKDYKADGIGATWVASSVPVI